MQRTSLCVLVLAAASAAACSTDPEVAKREYLASGDRYAAEKKYPEAIVQYLNSVQQDFLNRLMGENLYNFSAVQGQDAKVYLVLQQIVPTP